MFTDWLAILIRETWPFEKPTIPSSESSGFHSKSRTETSPEKERINGKSIKDRYDMKFTDNNSDDNKNAKSTATFKRKIKK